MLALFTLYLQDGREGFGWTAAQATTLRANYLLFVFFSPMIGGWLAHRKLDGMTLYKYISHKLIRWFTIYFLATSFIAFDAALIVTERARIAVALVVCVAGALLLGFQLSAVAYITKKL